MRQNRWCHLGAEQLPVRRQRPAKKSRARVKAFKNALPLELRGADPETVAVREAAVDKRKKEQLRRNRMTDFEWISLAGVALIAFALFGIAAALEKHTRHLSNIADRLLDIDNALNNRS